MENNYPPILKLGCFLVPLLFCLVFFMTVTKWKPGQIPEPVPIETVKARISHYWPPLGGVNCARFVSGECKSRMASGKPWQDWVDLAVACPKEYPFGTKFVIDGKTWVCMDRGGKITNDNGIIWLDMLTRKASVPYGSILEVGVIYDS